MIQPTSIDAFLNNQKSPIIRTTPEAPTSPVGRSPSVWSRRSFWKRSGLAFLVVGLAWAGWWGVRSKAKRGEDTTAHLPKYSVAKVDFSTVLTAFGRVESSKQTTISCELERLEIRNEGKTISSGGASTILSLVDEGTEVKAGDVLCSLDGSDYEELVRTQEIKTIQAEAAQRQAQLNFEVSEIAVKEYQEGLYTQNLQNMRGLITLAQSDLERAIDRLQWSKAMVEKGYIPAAKKADDEQTRNEFEEDLKSYQFILKNYLNFGDSRQRMILDAEVEKRRFEVIANNQRVIRSRERLDYYKRMLDCCTIRAPHDGFVIYAVDPYRPGVLPIEPGQTVRQYQKLFFLPDLANMQVLAYLHESVANRVHEGMRARAKIEGLSGRILEGHVVSIAPLPTTAGNWISDEVKYFVSVVKLDSVPKGIRPGMTAEIEFDVDRCLDVLAVPSEAVSYDQQGHNICYVAGVDGLERRSVTLGRSTTNLLEVTRGLHEGDQVVLSPDKIEAIDSLVVSSDREASGDTTENAGQPAVGTVPITVD